MSLLLNVEGLQKTFADEPVLRSVSFEIRRGQHVSLIGPNGAGKTTLLRLLKQELPADAGNIELAKGAVLGVLDQRPSFPVDMTLWQIAAQALKPLLDLQRDAEQTAWEMSRERDPARLAELTGRYQRQQEELLHRDAFQLDHKIERVLTGLGFQSEEYEQPASQLSGGQANRLMLAALLLQSPDLMLLDEPSNHLDLEATEWLEAFLGETKQAFLLVSHDRFFLDRVVDVTLELVHGTVVAYPGNFSKYRVMAEEQLKVQRRTYEKQAEEITRIEDFIRRNHYGQKAAQAEDRRKKLERIQRVDPPREIPLPAIRFPEPTRCGDVVVRVERLKKQFAQPLFENVTFQIERGQRWGVLGPNGCGKSTLLKCLVNKEHPDSGTIQWGTGVRVGYFDQKLEAVAGHLPAAEAIRSAHRELVDQQRRDLLGAFGITGDLALQTVDRLSGGERSRVALARLAADVPNVMILDEPTNHLDLWAREALERALISFDGTLLVVSHDRYFLNRVCTHLLVFEPHRVHVFPGSFDDYRHWQKQQQVAEMAAKTNAVQPRSARGSDTSADDVRRKRRFPFRKASEIEREIAERESQVNDLQTQLSDPQVLRSGPRVVAVQNELNDQLAVLEQLYEHWQEALEFQQ